MDELIKALNLRLKYNQMPQDKFFDLYEKWTETEVTKDQREEWKMTGLNNVDFFILNTDEII